MQPWPKTTNSQPAASRLRGPGFLETLMRGVALSVLAPFAVPAILSGKNLPAQVSAPRSTKPAQEQKAIARPAPPRRRADAHARVTSIEPRPAPAAIAAPPPAPPAPIWPANEVPSRASVTWDHSGLKIEASNSSLDQILHQVADETGAKFEGLTQDRLIQDRLILDQRIFGTYGPGPARDVLLQLLDGTGYNVLMIGGRDAGAPLQVVFSASSPASSQMAANDRTRSSPRDDDAAEPPEPETPPPPPMKTPFGNGDSGMPETTQQIMQDIFSRQQKIDQQQQRPDQQNNPQR